MENEFINPFANSKVSMTSLEKALKSGTDGTENAEINRSSSTHRKSDVIVRGVLSVTVLSAEDLPAMDLMGKSDPFVVLHMKKTHTKNKTRVTFRPRSFILFFSFSLFPSCMSMSSCIFSFLSCFSQILQLWSFQVVNDTLNPAWNQTFDFVVEDGLHDMLTLEVYDHDTFGKVCCCSSVLWLEIPLAQKLNRNSAVHGLCTSCSWTKAWIPS